ncbi:MAG: sigma-70 family RNA polymerase sigma factor [Gaiellales bacterium]
MDEVVPADAGRLPIDFADFFQQEHLRLGRAIYLVCGDRSEAEELIQEALARAYERWDRVSMMQEPAGYVYRTAVNLHRRRMRTRRILRPLSEVAEAVESDVADQADRHADVWTALSRLRHEQRAAVVLVELLGYEPITAARLLGIAPGAMRVRLHRARASLRRALGGVDV